MGKYGMDSCAFGGKYLATTFKKYNELLYTVNAGKFLINRVTPSFYEGCVARRYFPM
jgi:hypothetical protein